MKALLTTLTLWTATLAQNPRYNQNQRYQPSGPPNFQNYPTTQEPIRAQNAADDNQYTQNPYVTPIPIIKLSKQMSLDGSYKSSYETGNSIYAEESGLLKNLGDKNGIAQWGTYSYTDPDGRQISVKYTADEGGFRAEGEHLPTPPPVPPEVQKGLDIIFESIRQRQIQEAEFRKSGAESANFPPEDDGSYKPDLYH